MLKLYNMTYIIIIFLGVLYIIAKDYFITNKLDKMNKNLVALKAEVERIKVVNGKIAADIRRIADKLETAVTDEELAGLVTDLKAIADEADLTDAIVPEEETEG